MDRAPGELVMKKPAVTLATVITLCRIAFLPVLWWWAADGRVRWVGFGVMAAFLSDILDGQVARRMNQITRLGSQLDSIADSILLLSSIVWLLMFRRDVLHPPYSVVAAIALGTYFVNMAISLIRFRRYLNLHLYTGKASGVFGSIFIMDALAFGFHPLLFYLAFGAFTLGNLEGLIVMLTRSEVDEHIGSILKKRPLPTYS
jgi:phosphatidylglycerophosphate synthase